MAGQGAQVAGAAGQQAFGGRRRQGHRADRNPGRQGQLRVVFPILLFFSLRCFCFLFSCRRDRVFGIKNF